MPKSHLVTSSLFGSIAWYQNAPPTWKEKAYDDLYNSLARKKFTPNLSAQRGIKFENYVYKLLESDKKIEDIKCSDKFREFLFSCKDGRFQVKSKSFINVDGQEYCLFGKIDVLFPHKILDIKTTGKWNEFSENKYKDSMQHSIYLYNQNMNHFQYMIAVFEGEKGTEIKDIKLVNIHLQQDREQLKQYIVDKIREQVKFLNEHPVLRDLYTTTFSKYG